MEQNKLIHTVHSVKVEGRTRAINFGIETIERNVRDKPSSTNLVSWKVLEIIKYISSGVSSQISFLTINKLRNISSVKYIMTKKVKKPKLVSAHSLPTFHRMYI